MKARTAQVVRATGETRIQLKLKIDGRGKAVVNTGIPFFDHMLTLFAKHCDIIFGPFISCNFHSVLKITSYLPQ